MLNLVKNLATISLIIVLFLSSPIVMDEARDIYLSEIAARKAHPVKIFDTRTVGSSFQINYKGKRLTVTNNHVCSIVAEIERREHEQKAYDEYMEDVKNAKDKKEMAEAKQKYIKKIKEINSKEYAIVGKSLKIGDINRKILYNSPNHDICFLEPVGILSFDLASGAHVGETVTIIGHPRGFDQSLSDGRIVGELIESFPWLPKAGEIKVYRTTALSYPGNSGSPVINRYGNVIGILFAGYPVDFVNINFVVPVEYIYSELEAFIND